MMQSILKSTLFKPFDKPRREHLTELGIDITGMSTEKIIDFKHRLKAKWTGEFRPPHKGEWYLSGAIIQAYLSRSEMTTSYHIAKLILS